MISQTNSSNKKLITVITTGLIILLVLITVGIFLYQQDKSEKIQQKTVNLVASTQEKSSQELHAVNEKLKEAVKTGENNTTATTAGISIAEKYTPAVVLIQASWKLIHIPSGKQISQAVYSVAEMQKKFGFTDKQFDSIPRDRNLRLPVYVVINNSIEPYLILGEDNKAEISIGTEHSGSGFLVTDTGFILTNRHVAASWEVPYYGGVPPLPGFVIACGDVDCQASKAFVGIVPNEPTEEKYAQIIQKIRRWVPTNTQMLGGKPLKGKNIEGRLDYLEVKFPKTTTPWRATLEKISPSADVALIKIQTPGAAPSLSLCDSDPCVKVGEMVTVMGYPGISKEVYATTSSYEMGRRGEEEKSVIPEPTVTRGNVQKIIKGEVETMGNAISKYDSPDGEIFQLAINTTGHGNSGGPVFNDKGQVVGLFTYGWGDNGGARVSAAIPIKFGIELMGSQQVIK